MREMEEIRALVKTGDAYKDETALVERHQQNITEFDKNLNTGSFEEFLNRNPDLKNKRDKVNRKKFNSFAKREQQVTDDYTAVDRYKARYDRETWFYNRHSDTINKYCKKDNAEDDVVRIGYFKMLLIVWFDLIFATILFNYILCSPIHLVKVVSELFFRMRKPVMITVLIIMSVVILVTAMVLGVNWLTSLKLG